MYQIMQIFASITYYFLLYTEQCEQWFNIIQIDTNKKEKRKDTQYYCDKEIFNSFLPPPPPLFCQFWSLTCESVNPKARVDWVFIWEEGEHLPGVND